MTKTSCTHFFWCFGESTCFLSNYHEVASTLSISTNDVGHSLLKKTKFYCGKTKENYKNTFHDDGRRHKHQAKNYYICTRTANNRRKFSRSNL